MSTPPETKSEDFYPTKPIEIRCVLVGRTGEGKSATANTIFGDRIFVSKPDSESVTKECTSYKDSALGHNLLIVDTPGLFDTKSSEEETENSILKFVALTAPGLHIILLVMKVGRATVELQKSYERLCKLLGGYGPPYTIIVFTGGDDLEADGVSPIEYVQGVTAGVKEMLADSGYRYVVFNNRLKGKEREDQVNKLIQKIDALVEANKGGVLRSELYDKAEEALSKKEADTKDALLKKNEAEKRKLKERLKEKQKEIESFHFERKKSVCVTQQLQRREEQMIQMEREYEQKIEKMKQEHEAKSKSLEDQYQMELVHVRDETRQQINEDTVSEVSDSRFIAEQIKLKERLKEQQQEIESVHLERTSALRDREEQFSQMEREYEQKIAKIEEEHEAKTKTLEDQFKMELVKVRDDTRHQINEDTLKVSDSWFKKKLKRFLKI